jgi:hypothetical protein
LNVPYGQQHVGVFCFQASCCCLGPSDEELCCCVFDLLHEGCCVVLPCALGCLNVLQQQVCSAAAAVGGRFVCSAAGYDNGAWHDVTGHMCSGLFAALALVVAPPSQRGGLSTDVPPMVVCLFSAYCWGAQRGGGAGDVTSCCMRSTLHTTCAAHRMCSRHITRHHATSSFTQPYAQAQTQQYKQEPHTDSRCTPGNSPAAVDQSVQRRFRLLRPYR